MNFINLIENNLYQTSEMLLAGNFEAHPSVSRISLEGSRGLKGSPREDSDLDMSLILEPGIIPSEKLCEDILNYSLNRWKSKIELDLAVVFDKMGCLLKCFDLRSYDSNICSNGIDCVGIYKNQKGFSGFIDAIGLEVKHMYPLLIIWQK